MSPSFSTSSSDHRFGLRLVIAVFAATSVLLLCAGYANYRLRGLERHPQDVQLFQLERMKGPFDRLVLSDSVTENATAAMAFSEDTLPLLTHGWMRLAGQYLMFERVLARGPVHAMDFFMVPDMVVMDVDDEAQGRIRSTYTDTLFTRGEEIAALRESGDVEAGTHVTFFERAYKSLQPGKRRLPSRQHLFEPAPQPEAGSLTEAARSFLERRYKLLTTRSLSPQNQYFLTRFSDTCRDRKVTCRFIIEPSPESMPRIDIEKVKRFAPAVEVVDVNDMVRFPDAAFVDGMHLKPDWAAFYLTLLTEHGLLHPARTLPVGQLPDWSVTPVAFSGSDVALVLQDMHPSETWGRWTNGRHALVSFRLPAKPARVDLVLDVSVLARKGPQRVDLSVNATPLCSRELESGDARIACSLPEDLAGRGVTLKVETSYASSPSEWGEPDSRSLGIGLRTLSLQPRD